VINLKHSSKETEKVSFKDLEKLI